MGKIECWSVIGPKDLKTYCLLLIVQLTLKCTSLGVTLNTTYQLRVRSLQGNLRLGSIHQGEVWDFPVMTARTRLISYLLYVNSIKNTGSNFQHPHASWLGHSRSCSLNQNKPDDVINTTRYSSFDNETIFVFITSRLWPNWTTLKKFHNARSLQENLANSQERILCAINITVHLILRVVSAL